MAQPIIRGIQAVGAVDIFYKYNGVGNILTIPNNLIKMWNNTDDVEIDTSAGIAVAGFRLDSEFLRAVQQIASSQVIPILGGGGVALTNNNRTGSLTLTCAKVSTPQTESGTAGNPIGAMYKPANNNAIGAEVGNVYDMVFLAQAQQAALGGDSDGSTLAVCFMFCGKKTIVQFEGCTVATVDPIGLAGNDAANYSIVWNYLNWRVRYDAGEENFIV